MNIKHWTKKRDPKQQMETVFPNQIEVSNQISSNLSPMNNDACGGSATKLFLDFIEKIFSNEYVHHDFNLIL